MTPPRPLDLAPPVPIGAGQPVTRRRFVIVGAVGLVGTFVAARVGALGEWLGTRGRLRWAAHRARKLVHASTYAWLPPAERIVRHFDYLTLDRAGVDRFVQQFEREYGPVNARNVRENTRLYNKYLMSTDFFLNGADTARPVRFVALYDPHVTPCWRPFPPASA